MTRRRVFAGEMKSSSFSSLVLGFFNRRSEEKRRDVSILSRLCALLFGPKPATIPPAKCRRQIAAKIARDKGIVIHTVAVGDPQAAGEDALDVGALKDVSATTGGLYSHAGDRKQLEEIYEKLDQLETRKADTISHRPRRDVYWWPLVAGLAISMLQHGLQLALESSSSLVFEIRAGFSRTRTKDEDEGRGRSMIGDFHFLRPWWLAAFIPAALLFWATWWRQDAAQVWQGIVAPHLLPHLFSSHSERKGYAPLHLIAVGWIVTIVAVAGPTWRQEPAPIRGGHRGARHCYQGDTINENLRL